MAKDLAKLQAADVARHNTRKKAWIVIHGVVWDVTDFIDRHPGGANFLLNLIGQDATAAYDEIHEPGLVESTLGPELRAGTLDASSKSALSRKAAELPQKEEDSTLLPQKRKPPPSRSMINLDDFRVLASQHMKPETWAYVDGAADDEFSKAENARAYRKLYLRPRVLRDVAAVDSACTILGRKCTMPVYVSPVGLARLVHPEGECAIAAACGREGVVEVVNTVSSMPIERIMAARVSHDQPVFWQLYVDKDLGKSEAFVRRVEKLGVAAIWLTVDSPVVGKRERDDRSQAKLHIEEEVDEIDESPSSQGIAKAGTGFINASIDWSIIPWLRGITNLPLVIKGIQSVEDAVTAFEHGVQGIVLSNHGGRSQDTAQPPILTLLEIRRYAPHIINSGMQIYIDGGIRRGTDILKALALGATAVGIGRPALFALSAGYGEKGVRRMLQILRQELQVNMALAGAASCAQIEEGMVNTSRLERDVIGSVKL